MNGMTNRPERDAHGLLQFMGRPLPDGPWHAEPDELAFEYAGFSCALARNHLAALCGYIGVPVGHPWFGLTFLDERLEHVRVHGGFTYSRAYAPVGDPDTAAPGRWWLGFDCCHVGDLMPGELAIRASIPGGASVPVHGEYRTFEYVRMLCIALAAQALDAAVTAAVREETAS